MISPEDFAKYKSEDQRNEMYYDYESMMNMKIKTVIKYIHGLFHMIKQHGINNNFNNS